MSCHIHFKETDIAISISGRKNIPSDCYPTIFDLTKAENTTSARSINQKLSREKN